MTKSKKIMIGVKIVVTKIGGDALNAMKSKRKKDIVKTSTGKPVAKSAEKD